MIQVERKTFQEIDVSDLFFDSLRKSYPCFGDWFRKKEKEHCFVVYDKEEVAAFMYVKAEDEKENYTDITPSFSPKRRMKIGTLKVDKVGYGIGTDFVHIAKEQSKRAFCQEIYITIPYDTNLCTLTSFLVQHGFEYHGMKTKDNKKEQVYLFKESQ